jgi:hypothetical protein
MPQRLILEDEHNQIYQVLIESTAPASPQPTQNKYLNGEAVCVNSRMIFSML